ncbi:hypothetical protein [Poriferisphaera sp. WC338]|uniref:hypothetical protein n=1 Tax=Poriferisphaera sp. WC338 TaxID=3425129 RepID=UPI003D812EAF
MLIYIPPHVFKSAKLAALGVNLSNLKHEDCDGVRYEHAMMIGFWQLLADAVDCRLRTIVSYGLIHMTFSTISSGDLQ